MSSRRLKDYKQWRRNRRHTSNPEDGVALAVVLILVVVLSTVATGIMFSTQTELWATANYRSTTQARYVAEAGAQRAINFLTYNLGTYLPTVFSTWTVSSMPVTYGGSIVVMQSASSSTNYVSSLSTSSNSGSSTMTAAFQTAMSTNAGTLLTSNGLPANYYVGVQLVRAAAVSTPENGWDLAWKVVAVGDVTGVKDAKVQITEVVQGFVPQPASTKPLFNYSMLATGTGCDSIIFESSGSGAATGSYDSSSSTPSTFTSTNKTAGDIASAGNVHLAGGFIVYGSLYSGINPSSDPAYSMVSSAKAWYGTINGTHGGYTPNSNAACSSSKVWALNEDGSGSVIYGQNAAGVTNTYSTTFSGSTKTIADSSGNLVDGGACVPSYYSGDGDSGYYNCATGFNVPVYESDLSTWSSSGSNNVSSPSGVTDNTGTCSYDTALASSGSMCGGASPNWTSASWGAGATGTTVTSSAWVSSTYDVAGANGLRITTGALAGWNFYLPPNGSSSTSYGTFSTSTSGVVVHLSPGVYNFNAFDPSSTTIVIDFDAPGSTCSYATNPYSPACNVTINILGTDGTYAMNSTSGTISIGAHYDSSSGTLVATVPDDLSIVTPSTGTVYLGNTTMYGTINAPNATFKSNGSNFTIYGGVIAKKFDLMGSAAGYPMIYYDNHLKQGTKIGAGSVLPAHFVATEYSWNVF
jgi:Tfp pilus assembly protein PilX